MYDDDLTTEEYYEQEQQDQEEAYYFHTITEFESLVKAFGFDNVFKDLDKETQITMVEYFQ